MEIRILAKIIHRKGGCALSTVPSYANEEYFWELIDDDGDARARSVDVNTERYDTYFKHKYDCIDAVKDLMFLLQPSVDTPIYDCTVEKKKILIR